MSTEPLFDPPAATHPGAGDAKPSKPDYLHVYADPATAPFSVDSPANEPVEKKTEEKSEQSKLEAVLFLAREPWNTRKLAQYAQLSDAGRVRQLIGQLNHSYRRRRYPFRIVSRGGGYELLTRPQFGPWLRRLHGHRGQQQNLSPSALETLIIIACKQPVLRVDVESVRGVKSGEIIRNLMDSDLVRIVGRSDDLGRPFLYGTTKKFLTLFGLNSITELTREIFQNNSGFSSNSVKDSDGQSAIRTAISCTEGDFSAASVGSSEQPSVTQESSVVEEFLDQPTKSEEPQKKDSSQLEDNHMLHEMSNCTFLGELGSADFEDSTSRFDIPASTIVMSDDDEKDDDWDDEDDDWEDGDEDEEDEEDWDEDDWDEDDDEWELVDDDEDDDEWDDDDEDDDEWDDDDEDDEDEDDEDDWGEDDDEI